MYSLYSSTIWFHPVSRRPFFSISLNAHHPSTANLWEAFALCWDSFSPVLKTTVLMLFSTWCLQVKQNDLSSVWTTSKTPLSRSRLMQVEPELNLSSSCNAVAVFNLQTFLKHDKMVYFVHTSLWFVAVVWAAAARCHLYPIRPIKGPAAFTPVV